MVEKMPADKIKLLCNACHNRKEREIKINYSNVLLFYNEVISQISIYEYIY